MTAGRPGGVGPVARRAGDQCCAHRSFQRGCRFSRRVAGARVRRPAAPGPGGSIGRGQNGRPDVQRSIGAGSVALCPPSLVAVPRATACANMVSGRDQENHVNIDRPGQARYAARFVKRSSQMRLTAVIAETPARVAVIGAEIAPRGTASRDTAQGTA